MIVQKKPYVITRGKVIIDYSALYCDTTEKLLRSELFSDVVDRFIKKIASKSTSSFAFLMETLPWLKRDELTEYIVNLFRLLSSHSAEEIAAMNKEYRHIFSEKLLFHDFIEELYQFWRRFERFIYIEAPERSHYSRSSIHHAQFIKANEEFKNLVLFVYRRVSENLLGQNPRVYRQLPSGANMGMLLEKVEWSCPEGYRHLKEIPFIRLSLVEPPLILYPVMNKRKGSFKEIHSVTPDMLDLKPEEWYCFPARVGPLTAFIYFHQDFISLGLSLINLFEIADYDEIDGKKPELMLLFGLSGPLQEDTVFFEDNKSGILIGLVKHSEEMDYFGYFKKMILTLHNIAMLKRNRLPLHGAMVYLKLKEGQRGNVIIVGDSGAGKSETLEALRGLADEYICEMRIIFDDMGSIGVNSKKKIVGYGTEIGAFVRLDDLEPGYAYVEIDRSIFMNPDRTNARLIIPITPYHHIVKGYPVDMVLYANNYEQITAEHPAIEFFSSPGEAFSVFRSGARLAKGTTDEKGLVHTYFANPFGAVQRKEEHEKCASEYFEKMFQSGVRVGQIRTRLGIGGFEQNGPREAALELFKIIQRMTPEE
ncbi:MAG: phosphoenolpyruvate carboxykinase [bacterium]